MDKSKIEEFKRRIYDPNTLFAYIKEETDLQYLIDQLESDENILKIEFDESELDWGSILVPLATELSQCLLKYKTTTSRKAEGMENILNYLSRVKNEAGNNEIYKYAEYTLELIDKIPLLTGQKLILVFINFEHIVNMTNTKFYRVDGLLRGVFQHYSDSVSVNIILNSEEVLNKIFHDRKAPFYRGGHLFIAD